MSRRMSYICDVCGAGITGHSAESISGKSAQIKLWSPGEYRAGGGQRFDFCLNCYEQFVGFLETGRAKEERDDDL